MNILFRTMPAVVLSTYLKISEEGSREPLGRFTGVSWSLKDTGTTVTSEQRELFAVVRGEGIWDSLFLPELARQMCTS